ncbi:hypothetical protein [Ovoidimarina sediminis]|uniref:hypothetical protein n=1 Tax=Ovoidimarina sediminis TaxID=3079856 RepID=UPI00290D964A|nr:hypothetical protein [Rhodophyticola sp. MJ-SS7]MDU8942291.1 hypothetical protein [Rhodophyticola sp. MJ-SS7]
MKPEPTPLGSAKAAAIANPIVEDVTPEPFTIPVGETPVADIDPHELAEEMVAGAPDPLPMPPEGAGDAAPNLETFPGGMPEFSLTDLVPTIADEANDASGHEPGDTPGFLSEVLGIF